MAIGGEIFYQHVYLRTGSPKLEDRVLHVDMMKPYWSNFAEACDEFGNWVVVRSRYNHTCKRDFECCCLGKFGSMTQLNHLWSSTRLEILCNFAGVGHLAGYCKYILTAYKSARVVGPC